MNQECARQSCVFLAESVTLLDGSAKAPAVKPTASTSALRASSPTAVQASKPTGQPTSAPPAATSMRTAGPPTVTQRTKTFMTLVAEHAAEHKCSRAQAVEACASLYPVEHQKLREGKE